MKNYEIMEEMAVIYHCYLAYPLLYKKKILYNKYIRLMFLLTTMTSTNSINNLSYRKVRALNR